MIPVGEWGCRAAVAGAGRWTAFLTQPAAAGKWRSRYVVKGLAGLLDEPRRGAPRRITDEQVEEVVVKTLESTPRNATHWSTRSMAAATGISRPTVNRIVHIGSRASRPRDRHRAGRLGLAWVP